MAVTPCMFVCFIRKSLTNRLLFHVKKKHTLPPVWASGNTTDFHMHYISFCVFDQPQEPTHPKLYYQTQTAGETQKKCQMKVCELCKASSKRGRGRGSSTESGSDMASLSTCWTNADQQLCVTPESIETNDILYIKCI